MKKLSRGAIAAIALTALVPAGFAVARSVEHHRWHSMTPETRQRLDEGKLAMAKTALKLNADQEKLWTPVETELRAGFKARAEKRAEWRKAREAREKERAEGKKPDMSERLEKMSQFMSERADRMKALSAAFKPFYASLSQEQKDVLLPLVRDLGFGGKGHGGRWAHGGKRHGGWGHGGWGGRGEGRGHHEHRDGGAGGPPPEGGKPAAPQNAPDLGDEDGLPVPTDRL